MFESTEGCVLELFLRIPDEHGRIRVMRDSPAGDSAYSVEAVGDRLGRSGSFEGRARVARGARGHSPERISLPPSPLHSLGFSQFVYFLSWLDRTA